MNTLSGETLLGESDEVFEKWRKVRPTKFNKIIAICLNDFFPS